MSMSVARPPGWCSPATTRTSVVSTGSRSWTSLTQPPPLRSGLCRFPHFENEDVDACGDTLLVSNDRGTRDVGAILYVVDISDPATPSLLSETPIGWTGESGIRGGGHIANFVTDDCRWVWLDGGDKVDVVDLKDRAAPVHVGRFESAASLSDAFKVTHDTEKDSKGNLWSVGGGGAAGYKMTDDPLAPKLLGVTGSEAVNDDFTAQEGNLNDFILHNSQRRGKKLLVTEEDYIDMEGEDAGTGQCNGQGRFETYSLKGLKKKGKIKSLDTWETELNGMFTDGSADSKSPVTANCSSHWFDAHHGVAAIGWYEQGVRFVDYSNPKDLRQVGYYVPANGSVWAAYWSPTDPNHEIVYSADVYRGIDVLRISKGGSSAKTVTAPILDEWFGDVSTAIVGKLAASDTFGWACPIFTVAPTTGLPTAIRP